MDEFLIREVCHHVVGVMGNMKLSEVEDKHWWIQTTKENYNW